MAHLSGLPADIPNLDTPGYLATRDKIAESHELRGVALITGAPGLGKTHAVENALAAIPDPSCIIRIGSSSTAKTLSKAMLRKIGVPFSPRSTEDDLTFQLIDELCDKPRLIAFDEAQALSVQGMRQLQHVFEDAACQATCVLVGGHRISHTLDRAPSLRSRVRRHVPFTPLKDDLLLAAVREYHPMFAHTSTQMLLTMDRMRGHGVLRNWANMLELSLRHAPAFGDPDHVTEPLWHKIRTA